MDYSDLYEKNIPLSVKEGDVLVFGKQLERDLYIISCNGMCTYDLISLRDFHTWETWDTLEEICEDLLYSSQNGYRWIETIPFKDLELRRKDAEKSC